jgi:hypothetical protein
MSSSSDFFTVSIIARDERAVAKSIANLMSVSIILKRQFGLNVGTGTGVASARTRCLEALKKQFPEEGSAYTFWLDSDILITESPMKIAEYVKEAEERGVSFTANYHVVNTSNERWNVAGRADGARPYNDDELENAKPFELKVGFSGLGLCYIKMPLDYKFRDVGYELEDSFFFKDNPSLDLRYVPISNSHLKLVHI